MRLKKYLGTEQGIARLSNSEFEGEGPLTEIAPYAFHDHRELLEIYLPAGITEIGANAFYDCRNLRKLSFYDKVEDLGDGILRNCSKLSYVEVKSAGGKLTAIKDILFDISSSLMVNLYGNEIFFPFYQEQYMDYYEARIIKQINHGAGIHYRECLSRDEFRYEDYDNLFRVRQHSMEEEEGIILAKTRLCYPYLLKEEAKAIYLDYLKRKLSLILKKVASEKSMDELNAFIRTELFEDKEVLDRALDVLCDKDFPEAVGRLMEYRDEKFGRSNVLDLEI